MSDQNLFLIHYFNQLVSSNELNNLLSSNDHLDLLNTNLKFAIKHQNLIKCDKLIQFLEDLLINLIQKNDQSSEFNSIQIDFIIILCKLFHLYQDDQLNEKINSLILNNDLINLELKIEIVQTLVEECSESSNCSFYVDFIFSSLDRLFDKLKVTISRREQQRRTKLINNIVWIIFDLLNSAILNELVISNLEQFLVKLTINSTSEDEQLVELVLDLIASLIRSGKKEIDFKGEYKKFNQHKINSRLNQEIVKKIRTLIKNERNEELVICSLLHKSNSSIRKKARYICAQFQLLPVEIFEFLEVLEEKQVHLIIPFIDKRLNISNLTSSNTDIKPFKNVLEILIQRMFDHEHRLIRFSALKFVQDQYSKNSIKNEKIDFLSEQFILDQVILALQDNQIYNDDFSYDSLEFLSSISNEKLLLSLLDKQASWTLFGLYFILKQLYHNLDNSNRIKDKIDIYSIRKFLYRIRTISCEISIRVALEIFLVNISIQNLINDNVEDFEYLLNILSCLNCPKEIKIQNLISKVQSISSFHKQIELSQLNLTNDCVLIGFSRYWAIIYEFNKDSFSQLLDRLYSMNSDLFKLFLINFLSVSTDCDKSLIDYLFNKIELFKDLEILQSICSKEIDKENFCKISNCLIDKIRSESELKNKFLYLSLLNDLDRNNEFIFQQLVNVFPVLTNSSNFKLELQDEKHWQLLNKYLNSNDFKIDQIIYLFDYESNVSKLDFLSTLISRTSTDLNIYVIQFLGLILKNELDNQIPIDQTLVLKDLFTFSDLLFKSCLEIKKLHRYRKIFKTFIEQFAFRHELFHSDQARKFFSVYSSNQRKLDELFEKIHAVNCFDVKSFLLDHLCELVKNDVCLIKNELFSDLLLKNLEIACSFSTKEQILINRLKQELFDDHFISKCFTFEMNLDFFKETRVKALSTCLQLDLDTLTKLINKMIETEFKICSKSKIKNYVNSADHRKLTKIWQFIMMVTLRLLKLLDSDTKNEKIKEMLKLVYDCTIQSVVKQNSATLSVKLLQQSIIITLIKDRNSPLDFYDQFKELLLLNSTSGYLADLERNKNNDIAKIGYIVTLLSILFHLVEFKSDLKYFPISYLLTCNHYKTRLYSHLILAKRKIKIQLPSTGLSNQFFELSVDPKSISGSHNLINSLKVLQKDWFFSLFDCDKDLNLNFIFYLLPKLANLFEDDLIGFDILRKYFDCNSIELINEQSKLLNADKTDFSKPAREEAEKFNEQKEVFQTKGYLDPQLDVETNKQKNLGQLIICASLLDRPSNLGGLCRSSDIFGIKQLVIPNNSILKDREFTNLSVTAEQWVDIEEVYSWNLISYLREIKKNSDYSLIGIEQSTESICLTDFSFPEKSLIVLGNEREGLPVEILQMMDFCVEIPQVGIIKSLNVHVTGALIAFEYFKQHNLKSLK